MYALIFIIALTGEIVVPAFANDLEQCETYAKAMYEEFSTSWICAKVTQDPLIIGRTIIDVPQAD